MSQVAQITVDLELPEASFDQTGLVLSALRSEIRQTIEAELDARGLSARIAVHTYLEGNSA